MKRILFLAILAMAQTAHASRECDWAIQVSKDENYRIGNRNASIGQINGAMKTDNATLNTLLLPMLDARNHTVSVYDHESQAAKDSEVAVRQAILFVQGTIISNRGLKTLLERLKGSTQVSSDRSLSDQIRDAAQHGHMNAASKNRLIQLANAVALVEGEQADWKASESEILQSYLDGKSSLVDGLMDKLNQLDEQLKADLNDLQASYQRDQGSAADAQKNVTDMQSKIAGEVAQVAALQKANDASRAYMQVWDVRKNCGPPPDPHPFNPRAI